jgi:hypothetical protein
MLYMTILTWDPDKRDAVVERAKKLGFEHEGMKVIGTWIEAVGGRCFQLADIPADIDPALHLKTNLAWNDLMKIETVAVLNAADMLKFVEAMK